MLKGNGINDTGKTTYAYPVPRIGQVYEGMEEGNLHRSFFCKMGMHVYSVIMVHASGSFEVCETCGIRVS